MDSRILGLAFFWAMVGGVGTKRGIATEIMAVRRESNGPVFHLCMRGEAIILVGQCPAVGFPMASGTT